MFRLIGNIKTHGLLTLSLSRAKKRWRLTDLPFQELPHNVQKLHLTLLEAESHSDLVYHILHEQNQLKLVQI